MRIAMVMAGDEEGGLEKHVEDLVAGLAERGHEVIWIAHPKYANRVRGGARFEPVDLSRSRRNPIALWSLWQALRRSKPDIIHAQANKAIAMTSIAKPSISAKMIATVHNQKKRVTGISRFNSVISVSKQIAGTIHHTNNVVIYNGIKNNLPVTCKKETLSHPPDEDRFWLAVGRLVPAKGFDVLLKAMQKTPGVLQIAGEGPERKNLENQINELGLQARVELLGHRDDIPELMQRCRGLVISSRREGFSYAFAEALFSRCPVLSTDVPIPNEVLPPHLICPPNNVDALAELMNRFRPDPALIDSLFRYAETHLTLDSMLDNTLAVYHAVLDRRAS